VSFGALCETSFMVSRSFAILEQGSEDPRINPSWKEIMSPDTI
jgi:hypothetical protein